METLDHQEWREVARLVEVTNDAVVLCSDDGEVIHVNQQLLSMSLDSREHIIGSDIKDLLFSPVFERASNHRLPFSVDGKDCRLVFKLADGSFIPVNVRALEIGAGLSSTHRAMRGNILVAINSLEEQAAYDRQSQRLLAELQAANRRLSGTLSVIMSAVGSQDLPSLMDTVLNKLSDALDANGATVYMAENGGFKLRGHSSSLRVVDLPGFIPYGAGAPTYVLRQSRACRFYLVPVSEDEEGGAVTAVDLCDMDARASVRVTEDVAPVFRTMIAAPVFFGTQVLGVIELGWLRPCFPRDYDLRVLEVVCDYLSIELVGLVNSVRSKRSDELSRSLNRIRDAAYAHADDLDATWSLATSEMSRILGCRLCPIVYSRIDDSYLLDTGNGLLIAIPGSIEDMFFSSTAPAARIDPMAQVDARIHRDAWTYSAKDLVDARVVRIEQGSLAGRWLLAHALPGQGVFFDSGIEYALHEDAESGLAADGSARGLSVRTARPHRMFLLLRRGSQEPIDDLEYDYLVHLAHDYEMLSQGVRRKNSEHHIAQALQAGMRSTLGSVPGITADCLYSSATQQALVGGDFYTLIRLPSDRAVMILGDVSGKGIEAASMSALVKTALSAYAWEGASPQRMVRALNSMLMGFSRVETFATMFIASIDLRLRHATYCSAGHPPTMLVHPAHGEDRPEEIELLSVQSGVVGAFESMVYESGTFSFDPGDILFMYTDGAIEARDPSGAFFGEQRLRDSLVRSAHRGIEGLCGRVLGELDAFSNSALDDDIAMVALRFDGMEMR